MTLLSDAELLGENRAPIPRPQGSAAAPYDLLLLDRDGTLNVRRPGYVDDPEDLVLLPGAARTVAAANAAGCAVVLVSNQRGIATGTLTRPQLLAVHRALVSQLAGAGAWLDAIQVCPHEDRTCDCRKPRAGLLREALRRAHWASGRRSLMVGDQPGDLAAAAAAGVPSVQVGGPDPSLWAVGQKMFGGNASRV
ncbi:HAD-IIIA family hydrolase [Flexivirga sp.]|uniref:HAD-IIIA family hydrolase n=1 Tax=Flexivirga sp. TaxID=1962927 RepID=UPI003F7D51B9